MHRHLSLVLEAVLKYHLEKHRHLSSSSGGSPQISSGKTSPPQPSSGGSPQISSGKTSTIKQPNCMSQGSCTGINDATNLIPTTNAESKNSVQGGSVNVNT